MKIAKCHFSNTALCVLTAVSLGLSVVSVLIAGKSVKACCVNNNECPAETVKPDTD